jgi:hypothetical protein
VKAKVREKVREKEKEKEKVKVKVKVSQRNRIPRADARLPQGLMKSALPGTSSSLRCASSCSWQATADLVTTYSV